MPYLDDDDHFIRGDMELFSLPEKYFPNTGSAPAFTTEGISCRERGRQPYILPIFSKKSMKSRKNLVHMGRVSADTKKVKKVPVADPVGGGVRNFW